MTRLIILAYSLASYFIFFATFLYLVGFVEGMVVPHSVDGPIIHGDVATAVVIDLALIALFGIQHTIMARHEFKEKWTKIVPRPAERATFVLVASLILLLMFWLWQPIGGTIWHIEAPAARIAVLALSMAGWLIALLATFMIGHFELFGLRQAWLHVRGEPYKPPHFDEPGFYKFVRHPIYFGFLLAFWAAPTLTASHLLFALGMTIYILIGIRYEERDLMRWHGPRYADYRRRVRGLIPTLRQRRE